MAAYVFRRANHITLSKLKPLLMSREQAMVGVQEFKSRFTLEIKKDLRMCTPK